MEARDADRRTDYEDEVECEERLDPGGGPRVPRRVARRAQRLSAGAREKGHGAVEDVRIPAAANGRSGSRTAENRKAGAHARGEREVRHTLRKSAVLSQLGNETEKGAQSDRVRPRTLDGAVHQDEHGVPQAGQKRLRDGLLRADEQLGIWKDNGESAKSRRCEDSAGVGDEQDPQAGIGPVLRQIHTFQQ